jgi:hypothetical protein
MAAVGLLYVGAVLFMNGLLLLGKVNAKSAGVFNVFVGALQVIGPLYLIFTARGDPWLIFAASGIFLFGFTYLYVGIVNLFDIDPGGVGWYSLFVAIMALGYSAVNFIHFHDYLFGDIWLMWSFLWALFWVLLGLKWPISVYAGWVTLFEAWITATIPAFLILASSWNQLNTGPAAIVLAAIAVVAFIGFYVIARPAPRREQVRGTTTAAG